MGELERVLRLPLDPATSLLGINNRDLQTFEVTLENTRIIMESAPGLQARPCRQASGSTATATPQGRSAQTSL